MSELPPSIAQEYSSLQPLGKTQFALLFRGLNQKEQREHLLKISLTASATENQKREYDFLKENPHPLFPRVFSFSEIDSQKGVLIREYLEGNPLSRFAGKLSQEQILSISAQIARGLARIHFQGLSFGDISADNFIYSQEKSGDTRVIFIDFEFLGKRHEAGDALRGTPSFMAPELFTGSPPTIQSDLYAMGVLLYLLVTGDVPFKGTGYQELIEAHLFREIPNPAGLRKGFSEEFGLLILRLLNREPAERFVEANEFIRESNRHLKTSFETEPEPESLKAQEKIRAEEGYSLISSMAENLEKKKKRSAEDAVTLFRLYLKGGQTGKIRPLLTELAPDERVYYTVLLLNAEGKYREAKTLVEKNKAASREQFILPLVTALYYLGEQETAQACLEKAIASARAKKEEEKSAAYQIHLGNFLLFNRQIPPAVNCYEKGLHSARRAGLVHTEALCLMNLANAFQAKNQWAEALDASLKAKRIYELLGNRVEAIRTSLNISGIYRLLGHTEKSAGLLAEAGRFLKGFKHPFLHLYLLLLKADLEKKMKNFRQARLHLEEAGEILKKNRLQAEFGDLLVSSAEIALEEEKREEFQKIIGRLESFVKTQKDPLLSERIKTLKIISLLMEGGGGFKAGKLIAQFRELASQGDIEFALDNLARAIALCEKRRDHHGITQADYETLLEYQNELLRFCDKKLPADYRERFFFFYRHRPRQQALPLTHDFLLKRILETTRDLIGELDLNILVRKILHLMMEVTSTDRGFVIFNEEKPAIAYSHNMDPGLITDEKHPEAISWTLSRQALTGKKPLMTIDAMGDERFVHSRSVHHLKLKSIVILPFLFHGEVLGAVYLDSKLKSEQLKKEDLPYLEALADQIGIAVHNAQAFHAAKTELNETKQILDRQKRELHFHYSYKNFIGTSQKILDIFEMLDRVIDSHVPVLLLGESGTGKEMIAKIIHYNSARSDRRLVSINCGAIPETLLESELFGHVRGAFTGAVENKIGLFEQADGGTLFLDEIGDMPFNMQVKLLRTLQDMEIRPVGGTKSKKVDVRIICATHRDIHEWIKGGKFREDLYYRINVAEITLPALRERKEDIPLLANHILEKYASENHSLQKQPDPETLSFLTEQPWPGNVRQLENTLYNLCVFSAGDRITLQDIRTRKDLFETSPPVETAVAESDGPVNDYSQMIDGKKLSLADAKQEFEKEQIRRALKMYGGKVGLAADHLRMPRPQVSRLIKRYRIQR